MTMAARVVTAVAYKGSTVTEKSDKGHSAAGAGQGPSRKRAWDGEEPKASLLKRMAGPSDLKAGVGGKRTAEEVQRIIFEASKGSKYFSELVPSVLAPWLC